MKRKRKERIQMDKQRIEAAVREILIAIGEDPDREGLVETPARVARMYEEIFSGLEDDPTRHLKLFNESGNEETATSTRWRARSKRATFP